MIVMRYGPLKVAEEFFAIPQPITAVDEVRCRQVPAQEGLSCVTLQSTLLIDLAEPVETLFKHIEKDTRYEIRRGEAKDRFVYRLFGGGMIGADYLKQLIDTYAAFAQKRQVTPINRQRLELLNAQNELFVSRTETDDGTALVWHVYFMAHSRARLLYSVSLHRDLPDSASRALVGRANRYLHWKDIVAFRERGVKLYDFGGYYLGNSDGSKLRINNFKNEFGGTVRTEYNGFRFVSILGRCAGLILRAQAGLAACSGSGLVVFFWMSGRVSG